MRDKTYLPEVRKQYESLPYPPRDPADERKRLIHNVPACLLAINHHCFAGRKDFRAGFRCLVAGAGTGDSVIFLAEQLRGFDAEIVYLDLSESSRRIAEERARVRQLTGIRWVTASIMDLPTLGLGLFDYIECSGVLHHLESTEDGLAALNTVLRDDGAIFLMLYAKYGRQSVYDMQALLRSYLPEDAGIPEKIRMTRQLLATLPKSNSFLRDLDAWQFEISGTGFGDAGLYDLLLHSQDRCFDVPGIYALARSAGLHLQSFAWNANAYEPERHVRDVTVVPYLLAMPDERRHALAEQMTCNIRMHEFFLARQKDRGARLEDDANALRSYGKLMVKSAEVANAILASRDGAVVFADGDWQIRIPCTPISRIIYQHMDGSMSIGELRGEIQRAVPGTTAAMIDRELRFVFDQLHPLGLLYLIEAGAYGAKVPDYAKVFGRRTADPP